MHTGGPPLKFSRPAIACASFLFSALGGVFRTLLV